MRILWLNPWFGNYRVPVYRYLKEFSHDNFHLIYGKYSLSESLCNKLTETLGDKAIGIDNSKRLVIGSEKSDMANGCIRIPLPTGVYGAIKRVKPDVIIVDGFFQWAPIALWYCKLHNIPLIIDYERTKHIERNSPWWRTWYRKLFGKFVNGFIVNGSLTIEYLKELKLENKSVISGAMSADSYGLKKAVASVSDDQIKCLRRNLNITKGMTFIFIGQLVERKGIKELILAWINHQQKYPEDNLLVLGKGVLHEELTMIVKSNNLNVNILGQIPYDEIAPYYAVADVMVMPTLEDNWCLVVPEGMACGLPILCSEFNGGHPELVKDGENGYVFNPLNPESITMALTKIHSDNLSKMSSKSIEIESEYTPDKAASNILKCCQIVTGTQDKSIWELL